MDDAADAGLIRFTLPQNLQLRFGNLTVMVSEPEGSPRSIWSEDSKTLLASNARSTATTARRNATATTTHCLMPWISYLQSIDACEPLALLLSAGHCFIPGEYKMLVQTQAKADTELPAPSK